METGFAPLSASETSRSHHSRTPDQELHVMFRIIGAAVVYGFALFGLARYLELRHGDRSPTP